MKIAGEGCSVGVLVDDMPLFTKEMDDDADVLEFDFITPYGYKITVVFTGGWFPPVDITSNGENLEINGWVVSTEDVFKIKYDDIAVIKFEKLSY